MSVLQDCRALDPVSCRARQAAVKHRRFTLEEYKRNQAAGFNIIDMGGGVSEVQNVHPEFPSAVQGEMQVRRDLAQNEASLANGSNCGFSGGGTAGSGIGPRANCSGGRGECKTE